MINDITEGVENAPIYIFGINITFSNPTAYCDIKLSNIIPFSIFR